ncbi:MAG: alpha/beta hydrolase, partial [Bacteroidota bacterium]
MFYEVSGQGPSFCFQHGLSANIAQSKGTVGSLTDLHLVLADAPGHGSSPLASDQSASFDYYAKSWLDLMDQLQLQESIFGGISMGSGIAINLALRAPERIRALILIRPAWLDAGNPESLRMLTEAAPYLSQPDGRTKFEARADFQAFQQAVPKAADSLLGVFGNHQRPELAQVLYEMVADQPFSSMEDLGRINCPCLIIANDTDPLHPVFMAEAIHHKIPNSQYELVHSKYLDQTQHSKEVLQLVQNFIQQL